MSTRHRGQRWTSARRCVQQLLSARRTPRGPCSSSGDSFSPWGGSQPRRAYGSAALDGRLSECRGRRVLCRARLPPLAGGRRAAHPRLRHGADWRDRRGAPGPVRACDAGRADLLVLHHRRPGTLPAGADAGDDAVCLLCRGHVGRSGSSWRGDTRAPGPRDIPAPSDRAATLHVPSPCRPLP